MEGTQEIQDLLQSPELIAIQSAVASAVGLPILHSPPPFHDVLRFQRVFHFLRISCAEVRLGLEQHSDALIRFSVSIQRASDRYHDDGEFAPGEEPGPEEGSRTLAVLGICDGFGIDHFCFFYVVSCGDTKKALEFLKFRRIPGAPDFYRDLKTFYRDASAA